MTPYQYQKLTESFCKLRSTCGLNNELDIHGMYWDERIICKVLSYDRTNGLIHVESPVKNSKGENIRWISDLKRMEFCLENGDKIPNSR